MDAADDIRWDQMTFPRTLWRAAERYGDALALDDEGVQLSFRELAARAEEASRALSTCDLLVTVGTSGVVYPAADLPRIATQRGIPSIEINLEDTPVSHLYTHPLRGKASELLEGLM